MCDVNVKESSICLHIFSKGIHKGERCTVVPHNSTAQYCAKHRVLKQSNGVHSGGPNRSSIRRIDRDSTNGAVTDERLQGSPDDHVMRNAAVEKESVEVDCHTHVYFDAKVVEEVPWIDVNAGYYENGFWDQKVFVPVMDASGSDSCQWCPAEINY